MGYGAKVSAEGSGRNLWRDFPSTLEKHEHKRGGYGSSKSLAKSVRRKIDRFKFGGQIYV